MSALRSAASLVLLLAAVAMALVGVGSHWLDRAARTPEPVREFVGTVTRDDAIIQAVATQMEASAFEAIPDLADLIPGLRTELESALRQGIDLALSDADLNRAWYAAVDQARADTVAGLDAMRDHHGSAPLVSFPLTPFIELGEAKLFELSDPRIHPYLDQIQLPRDAAVPLGVLPAQPAHWAAEALGISSQWRWYFGVAGILAVVGLLVGSRRGRWVALLLAAGAGIVAIATARLFTENAGTISPGSGVAATLRARIIDGVTESLNQALMTAFWAGIAILVVAGIGLMLAAAASRAHRRSAR
ncbi:MAG TPA: hypothetical protein K8V15_06420 [Tessaracoccus flavescens]|uniref:Integral membrane protein n=1 Tax=Tessaracoccus flavescens TaxID=399497 RepID=A0A921EQM3_9ACTN|nr:hypothetical protein [Tessaracoccus flavescens]